MNCEEKYAYEPPEYCAYCGKACVANNCPTPCDLSQRKKSIKLAKCIETIKTHNVTSITKIINIYDEYCFVCLDDGCSFIWSNKAIQVAEKGCPACIVTKRKRQEFLALKKAVEKLNHELISSKEKHQEERRKSNKYQEFLTMKTMDALKCKINNLEKKYDKEKERQDKAHKKQEKKLQEERRKKRQKKKYKMRQKSQEENYRNNVYQREVCPICILENEMAKNFIY